MLYLAFPHICATTLILTQQLMSQPQYTTLLFSTFNFELTYNYTYKNYSLSDNDINMSTNKCTNKTHMGKHTMALMSAHMRANMKFRAHTRANMWHWTYKSANMSAHIWPSANMEANMGCSAHICAHMPRAHICSSNLFQIQVPIGDHYSLDLQNTLVLVWMTKFVQTFRVSVSDVEGHR